MRDTTDQTCLFYLPTGFNCTNEVKAMKREAGLVDPTNGTVRFWKTSTTLGKSSRKCTETEQKPLIID